MAITYFALGTTLSNMANLENILTESVQVPALGRVAYGGVVRRRAGSGRLRRDGVLQGRWILNPLLQSEFETYVFGRYASYTVDSLQFYISTLDEFGHYTPYLAWVERPSIVDGTLEVTAGGYYLRQASVPLFDCVLASTPTANSNHTLLIDEHYLPCDTTSGSITLALTSAASMTAYTIYSAVKTVAANSLIIDPNGTEKIDGASTKTVTALNARVDFYTDGSNWYTVTP